MTPENFSDSNTPGSRGSTPESTATPAGGTAPAASAGTGDAGGGAAPQGTQATGGQVREAAAQAKDQAKGMAERAREQVTTQLAGQKDRATDQLGSVTEALRQTSRNLREQDQDAVAGFIDDASGQVERLSNYLRNHTVSEFISEAERFARREPALFFGGAMLLGLFGARFLKSSSPDAGYGGRSYGGYRSYGSRPYRGRASEHGGVPGSDVYDEPRFREPQASPGATTGAPSGAAGTTAGRASGTGAANIGTASGTAASTGTTFGETRRTEPQERAGGIDR